MNSNETALTIRPAVALADVMTMGKIFAASGFFADAKQEAQAIVKIMAGQEMGIPALMAMTKIYIIQGKVVIAPEIMAALIKKSGTYNYRVTKWTNEECNIVFYENGEDVFESSFTMEDAKRAKLHGKDNWQSYPRNMLFARALSNGARLVCPHVINGAYVPEELGAPEDSEGNVVESTARTIEPERPASQPEPPQNGHTKAPPNPGPPAEPPSGDGKLTGTGVKIQAKTWMVELRKLVAECPHYGEDGKPNINHILSAIAILKYPTVTDENIGRVMDALRQRAADKDDEARLGAPEAAQGALLEQATGAG